MRDFKKWLIELIAACFLFVMLMLLFSLVVNAKEKTQPDLILEPKLVNMTYYSYTGSHCANGKAPRAGIAAYHPKYVVYGGSDYVAIVYEVNPDNSIGDLIGYYEIFDTGYGEKDTNGKGTIQNGNTIDIFHESDSSGRAFLKEHCEIDKPTRCYIQVVKSVG